MPVYYCSDCGGKITYSGVKPANCPECGVSLSNPLAPPKAKSKPAKAAIRPRRRWEVAPPEVETWDDDPDAIANEESVDDIRLDPNSIKSESFGGILTVEQLRAQGSAVERGAPPADNKTRQNVHNEFIAPLLQQAEAALAARKVSEPKRRGRKRGGS